MSRKLKILQLAPRFPFPMDDGGKIGIGNILIQFSRLDCDVSFLTFYDNEIPKKDINELEKYANPILLKHSTKNTPFRILKSIFTNSSIYINKHSEKIVIKKIEELFSEAEFDVIHADHSAMASLALYMKSLTNKPAGLRLHNIEWMIWQRYADILPIYHPKKLYIQHQANLLKKFESEIYYKFDICFPITDLEKAKALQISPNSNHIVSGPGIDPSYWVPDENVCRNSNELIIATFFSWRHNLDGLLWFIKNVMPLVRKINPDITLTVIGKDIPEFLRNYTSLGVNVIGYVDDVRPYLNKAGIYIVPLFVGAGIRIKIIEAMAMQLPVLATSIAAEGINARSENGLFICNNENEFSSQILELTKNIEEAKKLGAEARKFSTLNFSWEKNVNIIVNYYKKLSKFDN